MEKGTKVLMRSLGKYGLSELQKKSLVNGCPWNYKKLLSLIFIVFSKNAKIIGESLHDYL